MFVLGLQGSPRTKGNTNIFLSTFLAEAERLGAHTQHLDVACMNISPCQECGVCEEESFCPIDDDMQQIYPLLRQADIIVMATPIFFYGPTAQMKTLIDRSQILWARRYVHKLIDPGRMWRRGFLMSLGATKGKNLFEGVSLTAKYFFDAVGASFDGSLTYRQIEKPGEIAKHSTALADTKKKARTLVTPFLNRKKILFVCTEDACRSQMASAFVQYHAGDKIEVESAGRAPAQEINPRMEEVMREKGMDMAFRKPKSIEEAVRYGKPELIISMGCEEACSYFPGVPKEEWDLPNPFGKSIEFMRQIRNDIEERVSKLIRREIGRDQGA
ncbi:MAG: NAD(P)H-dependent oxidoreductase [Deltaproteobacteria bacterium]|nr:NAD(P)H-dependent oxidoreductase [Deltaproteobacteria bacterium]MBW2073746.1 NAD(P)H-dependent oxidoreductase [Deltaproteobacteria bacterium]RLB81726.1 MAG: flavin reductase [Deltaproteobacteria bacterium]